MFTQPACAAPLARGTCFPVSGAVHLARVKSYQRNCTAPLGGGKPLRACCAAHLGAGTSDRSPWATPLVKGAPRQEPPQRALVRAGAPDRRSGSGRRRRAGRGRCGLPRATAQQPFGSTGGGRVHGCADGPTDLLGGLRDAQAGGSRHPRRPRARPTPAGCPASAFGGPVPRTAPRNPPPGNDEVRGSLCHRTLSPGARAARRTH